MSTDTQQRAQQFIKVVRSVIALGRYGRREAVLATAGFVLLAVYAIFPEAPGEQLPEVVRSSWPWIVPLLAWVPVAIASASVVLLLVCVAYLFRQAQIPLPDIDEPRPSALKGAGSFGPQDGDLFSRLGRDAELAKLRGWILDDQVSLVVVMGESGVGKTSLLRSVYKFSIGPTLGVSSI